jgi:hypothetical protein
MLSLFSRLLRRKAVEPHIGPQGEEYDALQMQRRHEKERGEFAENVIKKVGHEDIPFLDDPYR